MNERYERGVEVLRNEAVDPAVKARIRMKLAGARKATWTRRLAWAAGGVAVASAIILFAPQKSEAQMLGRLMTSAVAGGEKEGEDQATSLKSARTFFTNRWRFEEYEDYIIKESRGVHGWTMFANFDLGKTKELKAVQVKDGVFFEFLYPDPKTGKDWRYFVKSDASLQRISSVSVVVADWANAMQRTSIKWTHPMDGAVPVFGNKKIYDLDHERQELWARAKRGLARAKVGNRDVLLAGLVSDREGNLVAVLSNAEAPRNGVIADQASAEPAKTYLPTTFKLGDRRCVAIAARFDHQLGKIGDLLIPVGNDVARFRNVQAIETVSTERLLKPRSKPFWEVMAPWQKLYK